MFEGYWALRRGAGLVGGAAEAVRVEGRDAVSFLEGLLSQDIEAISVGRASRSFLLAPQGKLRALLWVVRAGDQEVLLVADRGMGERVAADLRYFKVRVKATIEPDPRPVSFLVGPEGGEDAGVPAPLPTLPRRLLIGETAEAPAVDGASWAAVRIEEGEPVMGKDVDERTIPQETGLVGEAVSFTKGCYLGQELVARIDTRGHVNRRLTGLVIPSEPPPPEGAALLSGEREVGSVTSVAWSPRLTASVGMALLRREVEPGHTVAVRWDGGSAEAVVHSLPINGLGRHPPGGEE